MDETPTSPSTPPHRLLNKVRRTAARAVLVDDDHNLVLGLGQIKDRLAALDLLQIKDRLAALEAELARTNTELTRARAETERYRREAAEVELRTGHHTDLVVAELWRRAETVDARHATAIQQLVEDVAHLLDAPK